MGTYLLRNGEDFRISPYFTKPQSRNIKNLDDLRYWYQFRPRKIMNSNTSIEIKDLPLNEEALADLIRSLEEPALSYEKLYDCFVPKASPHQGFREDREKKLENASTYPHFAFALLRVIACPKGFSPEHDRLVCMAAARRLKDFFSHKLFEIPNQERDYLKTLIFCLMLSPPFPCIDSLLDCALDVLCNGGKQSRHRLFWVPISELNLEASHTSLTGSLIDDAKSIIRNFQEHRDGTNLFFNALHYCTYRMQKRVLDMFYKIRYPASNDTTIDHHSLLHIQCCRILSLSHRPLVSQEYLVHRFPRLKEYLVHRFPRLKGEFSDQGGVLSTIDELQDIKNLDDLRYWYQFRQPKIINSNTSIKIKDLPFNEEAHAALIRSLEEPALSYEKLYDCFVPKASPHQGFREDREKKLENASKASTYPHFAFALLRVIACPEGFSPEHDRLACMAAARRLKDFLSHKLFEIPNQERDYLKTLIFCLMLSPPFPSIDSLLDCALDVLCNGGKQSWHRLFWVPISELNLEASHTSLTGSLIDDAKSIIRNFQEHRDRTNLFFNALHYCTYRMQKRVLDMFYKTVVSIRYPASNDTTIDHHSLLHIQCCRILSLSHRLLVSQRYLVHRYPCLKEEFSDQGGVLSTIDKLRFSVCENIALVLMSNHQERCHIYGSWDHELELELYIISPVIFLLQNLFASTSSSCDLLIVSAANCLMKSTSNDFIKSLVFREIVIPNVCVKDEDERLFEENCHEFIQSDMYASDSHTKRGIACNFFKKLVMKAEKEFATMLSKEMREMLAYKDWKIKECAICLVVLLMAEDAEGNSILSGMEERGCYFVDPNSFFKSVIEPELRSNKVNEFPMLKAAALKFLGKLLESRDFVHSVFSESLRSDLVHSVSRFFHSKSKVVHTYALNSALVLLEKFPASQELERLEEETFKFL